MTIPKIITSIATDAGDVAAEIVSVVDKALLPAGPTRLMLKKCEDGTFLVTTTKPPLAPLGVGFRITRDDLRAFMALIDGAT